jgi:putative PEP-CTERM system histidine kinase
MDLTAWGQALAGLAYSLLVLRVAQVKSRQVQTAQANGLVIFALLASALWGWLGLSANLLGDARWLLLSRWMDSLRYAGWFAFLLVLLRQGVAPQTAANRTRMALIAVLLVAAGMLMELQAFATDGASDLVLRWIRLDWMMTPVLGLVLLEQVFRNATEDSRWNIKPLCIGLGGIFAFDIYVFSEAVMFSRVDADALSIRYSVHALVTPLLVLSMTRRKDWISKISISPKAAFHSATLLMAGLYLLFMSAVGYYVRYFGGAWGRALQVGLVFFGLILLLVLAMSGALRASLRVYVGKHFFRYRYDYREEWLKFTNTLSHRSSPKEMGEQVIRGLAEMLESPAGALWLRDAGKHFFTQAAQWNMPDSEGSEAVDSPLCDFLLESGWVINLEEYRSYPGRYGGLKLPAWLSVMPKAWLVVPLMVGPNLIGFVVLASARTHVDVNWEVNDLLKTAGQQAASFLAQMQATEALLEARKFDAFNRMSAFVVHDLKNIVTQLSLMMKNARRLSGNPEFQEDMLLTVENSLDRMRQLMLQLREGATPAGTSFGVDLTGIVERLVAMAKARDRVLEVEHKEPVSTRGQSDRLERVIGHIVQNAFDATDKATGRVGLRLERVAGQARIVVTDTGQGMSQEFIRERLFKPFQTTKQAGMGIGVYESFQYVQELGGKIDVQSELGVGTVVTVLLPVFESQMQSDLR